MNNGISFGSVDGNGIRWELVNVLALLASYVVRLRWIGDGLDFSPSPAARRAELLLSSEVEGVELLNAVAGSPQLVEGTLFGRTDVGQVMLEIRAIDGMHWDIYSSDPGAMTAIREAVEEWVNIERP
jgi:hypothetical protein